MNSDNANDKIVRDKKPTITAEQAEKAEAFLRRQGYPVKDFIKTVDEAHTKGYPPYCTIDLKTGKPATDLNDGYMVSFQVNKTVGVHRDYTPEEYDMYVYECVMRTGSVPYLGFYGNAEISFKAKDYETAMGMAKDYNQRGIYRNRKDKRGNGKTIYNPKYNRNTNPTED
jgi:hypothetical protein